MHLRRYLCVILCYLIIDRFIVPSYRSHALLNKPRNKQAKRFIKTIGSLVLRKYGWPLFGEKWRIKSGCNLSQSRTKVLSCVQKIRHSNISYRKNIYYQCAGPDLAKRHIPFSIHGRDEPNSPLVTIPTLADRLPFQIDASNCSR
jgi:hypothetical protein